RGGRFDPLHPLMFPTAYIAVATLAPTAWLLTQGNLGLFRQRDLSADAPLLMSLAVVGFALGAAVPFRRRHASRELPRDSQTLTQAGRLLLAVPFLLALNSFRAGGAAVRGGGQGTRDLWVSVATFG